MRSTNTKDLYNLMIKANWGFSSTMSRLRGFGGKTRSLEKKIVSEGANPQFNDAVISLSSVFLEASDSGNRLRGVASFFGLMGFLPLAIGLGWLAYALYEYEDSFPLFLYLIFLLFCWLQLLLQLRFFVHFFDGTCSEKPTTPCASIDVIVRYMRGRKTWEWSP